MNTEDKSNGSKELAEFMRTLRDIRRIISKERRRTVGAVLGALLIGAANCGAQEFRSFDKGEYFRSGDRGSWDRGRDSDRDRDRRDSGGDRGSSSSYGSSSRSSSSTPPVTSSHSANKVRLTMGLQSTYVDIDTDHDNQIGLYEWKKAKRPLAQFTQLDANHDGFLTPRELERGVALPPTIASTPHPSTTTPNPTGSPTPSSPIASTAPTPSPAPVASKLSEEELTKADEAQGKNIFSALDRDHDGKITAAEMATSTRIRPMFEQAGIKFDQPMQSDQFVSNYVRLRKGQRT